VKSKKDLSAYQKEINEKKHMFFTIEEKGLDEEFEGYQEGTISSRQTYHTTQESGSLYQQDNDCQMESNISSSFDTEEVPFDVKTQKWYTKEEINKWQCKKTILAHDEEITRIIQLNDGRIVTASKDCLINVWDKSANLEMSLASHKNHIQSIIQLTEDQIVSGSNDYTLKIWSLLDKKVLRSVRDNYKVSNLIKLTEKKIISSSNNCIKIWRLNSKKCKTIGKEGHQGWILSLCLLKDGRIAS